MTLDSISIIIDSEHREDYYLSELDNLVEETGVEIDYIAIDQTTNSNRDEKSGGSDGVISLTRAFLTKLLNDEPSAIIWAEKEIAERFFPSRTILVDKKEAQGEKRHIDTVDALSDSERIYFEPEQVGSVTYEIPDSVTDTLSETDVVILIGFNRILRGRILTEPKHGVLSPHGSDIRRYRGRPGAFWQFLNGEDEIGLTLQQLTPELDGGNLVVCRHGDITDANTWWEAKLVPISMYDSILVEGIQRLQDPEFQPIELSEDELGVLTFEKSADSWSVAVRMTLKNFYGRYLK